MFRIRWAEIQPKYSHTPTLNKADIKRTHKKNKNIRIIVEYNFTNKMKGHVIFFWKKGLADEFIYNIVIGKRRSILNVSSVIAYTTLNIIRCDISD